MLCSDVKIPKPNQTKTRWRRKPRGRQLTYSCIEERKKGLTVYYPGQSFSLSYEKRYYSSEESDKLFEKSSENIFEQDVNKEQNSIWCTVRTRKSRFFPVLWIRDFIVRTRFRITGSVPLIYGSGSGSCFFRQWLTRCKKN
jgi:hypothetical protein